MSVGRGNNKKYKFFVSIVCLLFLIFASSLTISLAIFRSDKSDVQQNSFGAVVLHDNSQYKYKSKIQNKLVGEEYLFNDIKLTVADNTSPVFIRAHVYFDSTNEVAKDKIKFNSFSIKNHENYTWSRFGDYWYLCDKSGNLMQLNSTKAGEVYVFLIQSDAVVPEMQGVLGDDEFVSCEIVVQSSLASNFSNTTNFSEINKSFDKNATETTKTGTYSVVFKQNGATLSTQTINYGGKATIPEVTTAEGDVFLCWNTREDGSGANITNEQLGYITQNLTLFPMFENQKVLVTVVQSEGGTISPETQMVDWGSDLVMHFTPNKNYVLKRILIDGDPVGATSEYLLKRITGAVVVSAEFVSDYIVLDINGGAGEQPNVVYNGDQTKFMLEGNEPTKSGKEFYYYSTNSADNEQGQNGDRYDLGYWYDVPNTSGTTTLFAIYLTPSSNYQTAQNYVVVPKNVSAIADSAVNMFSGTNNTVKFVTLPRQTSKIGKNAFANCSGLVGVSMSNYVSNIGTAAFKSDKALAKFIVPKDLATLGNQAFMSCTALTEINLTNTQLTTIESDCFANCSNLSIVKLPTNITRINFGAFQGSGVASINLEDTKLEEFDASVFMSCSQISVITVPSTLKKMGQSVFMFSGITEVKNFAGTSVSSLEKWTFWFSSLIQIELPETLEIINEQVFASCSELTRVGGLQNTKVTQILDGAFSGCSKLKNVIFPQTLLTLGGGAYSGCSALTNVTFNSNLKTIGANAFEGCSSLSQLTGLEKTVVATIGDSAFKDCTSLVDVSLPNTIQTIGANAFANCSGLATINFINDSNLSTLSVAANSFTGTTSDLKVNILDESHFDEYISKLNGKGFAENAFMFFLGNIDRKAYYKNAVWEKFHDAVITSTAGEHGTISPSGTIIYSLGSSASYVISPETGYKIKKILVDGVEIVVTAADGAAQRYEFVDIQKDHTISAEFEQRMFKITVVCGGNGKIEPSTTKDYAYGSEVAFVITPNDGYVIKDVLIDGVSNAKAKENAKYTFSNLRANHKIEVSFEVVTFTIVSSVGEGGTMSPDQITTIKNWGENHSVTYTPNDKFVISTIVVDGQALNLSGDVVSKPYTYTFSKITANHVISCQFESTQRTLTYDPNGGTFVLNTDIDLPSTTDNYNYRTIAQIGLVPKTTYTINFASATLISGTATEFHVRLYKFGKPSTHYAFIKVPFGTNVSAVFTSPETLNPSDNNQILVYAGLAGATAGNNVSLRGITMSVTKTLTWDSVCGVSPTPTREGYNFKGWSTESEGSTQDFSNKKYSSVFGKEDGWLYAIWEIKQFQITTSAGAHGTITESMTVDWGTTATVEMKPDEGYRVATYSIDGGNAINSTAKAGDSDYFTFRNITANHKISVTFAPITYTIKYNGNGATSGSTTSSSHTYDEEKELTANGFSRTGYNFAGWATISNGNVKYSNKQKVKNLSAEQGSTVELYAVWAANQYTVTFNPNGGTVSPTSQTVVYGQEYGAMPIPTRTGYAFGGWIGGKNLVNNNIQQNGWSGSSTTVDTNTGKYTFRTSPGGGTGNAWRSFYVDVSGYVGKKVSISGKISAISPNNATISNINIGQGNSSDFPYHIAGSSDRKQIYETSGNLPVTFSHTCTIIGGTSIMGICIWMKATGAGGYVDVTVENLQIEVAEAATSFESPNQSVDSSTIVKTARDHTLYAQWTPITYTVVYNGNTNTGGSTASSTHTYNEAKNLTANGFTKTGYTFAGWATSQSGNVVHADKASVKNLSATQGATITFYAKWNINSYTLSIDPNGGYRVSDNSTAVITVTKNYQASENISERRKTGYTLTGYTLKNTASGSTTDIGGATFTFDNSTKTGVFTQGTVACTLVAQWTVNTYCATFMNCNLSIGTGQYNNGGTWSVSNGIYSFTTVSTTTNGGPYLTNLYTLMSNGEKYRIYFTAKATTAISLTASFEAGGSKGISLTTSYQNFFVDVTYNASAQYKALTFYSTGWRGQTFSIKDLRVAKRVDYNSTYGTLPTPTRPGYTFDGWYTSPKGHTLLEYIQSSGTQYIDTGLTMEKSTTMRMEIMAQLTSNDNFAGVNGYMQHQASLGGGSKGLFVVDYNGNTHIENVYFNDVLKYNKDWTSAYSESNNKVAVIGMGDKNNTWWTNISNNRYAQVGKWYYIKVYRSGTLVRNFIPAKRNSDNVVGLYDLVEGKFYINSGTGTFTAGATQVTSTAVTSSTKVTTASDHTLYAEWTRHNSYLLKTWKTALTNKNANYKTTNIKTIKFVDEIPSGTGYTQVSVGATTKDGSAAYVEGTKNVTDVIAYVKQNGSLYDVIFYSPITIYAPVDSSNLFGGSTADLQLSNMTSITLANDMTGFNTSNVTTMQSMFSGCSSLTSLNLSKFNTSKVTTMYEMFNGCSNLSSLNISGFNTGNVTTMRGMFFGCSSLTSLNLTHFNTSKVTVMWNMFNGCSKLSSLNVSSFNTSNVTDMDYMFSDCSSLKSLNLSSFNMSNINYTSGVLNGCTSLTTINTPNAIKSGKTINLPGVSDKLHGWYKTTDTGRKTLYETISSSNISSTLQLKVALRTLVVNWGSDSNDNGYWDFNVQFNGTIQVSSSQNGAQSGTKTLYIDATSSLSVSFYIQSPGGLIWHKTGNVSISGDCTNSGFGYRKAGVSKGTASLSGSASNFKENITISFYFSASK